MSLSISQSLHEMLEHTFIIIPCYNEAKRLPVLAYRHFFEQFPQCRFWFINDGSEDKTLSLLQGLAKEYPQITVLPLQNNRGKTEAVCEGMLHCAPTPDLHYMGYWDADLATPLEELTRFLEIFQTQPQMLMVVGSRVQLMGRTIERHWY